MSCQVAPKNWLLTPSPPPAAADEGGFRFNVQSNRCKTLDGSVDLSGVLVAAAPGVFVPRRLLMVLTRAEACARKEVIEAEQRERDDAAFLIAVARSTYRQCGRGPSPSPQRQQGHASSRAFVGRAPDDAAIALRDATGGGTVAVADERDVVERTVDMTLFYPHSPRRGVLTCGVPEMRPGVLRCRAPPTALLELMAEEGELRQWLERLEAKLREPLTSDCIHTYLALTGPQRLQEEEEPDQRVVIYHEEEGARRRLVRHARMDRPPVNRPPPPELSVEGQEVMQRAGIAADEAAGRAVCHSYLVERFGVQLFSANRVEAVLRYEIEDAEADTFQRAIRSHFHTLFRAPLLAQMALLAPPGGRSTFTTARSSSSSSSSSAGEGSPVLTQVSDVRGASLLAVLATVTFVSSV